MVVNPFASNASDPFYNINRFQKDPNFDWTKTDAIGGASGMIEKNPQIAWTRYLSQNYGVNPADESAYAKYVRNLYNTSQRGFEASLSEDPTLTYQRYLQSLGVPNFQQQFANLNPAQRGENISKYAGPVRWIADI